MVTPSISRWICGSVETEGALPVITLRRSMQSRGNLPFIERNSRGHIPFLECDTSCMHGVSVNLDLHLDTCNSVGPSVGPTMPTSPVPTSHSCTDVRGLATTQAPQARVGTRFSEKPYCSTCRPTWHCSETE
ncbi:hypothetical protein VNO80_13317 [Phaseolus coccineus]|uniref:Uncharacterized protein n=1 Tax=Phaseolus coccineus TaxID=3886 RepID=A0AAN9R6W8_PHACN